MLPDVLEFILERSLPSEPATLGGFSRYMVRDRVFPAVIPDGKHDVHGLVLFGLTADDFHVLDDFESEIYERRPASVRTTNGFFVTAELYVLKEEFRSLLSEEEWNCNIFKLRHLGQYLRDVREWKSMRK